MTGRRTRRSASTEVVQSGSIHWRQETSVLKTVPVDTADNDYPDFELTETTVFKKDGKTMADALDVLLEGPFMIRGILVKESPDQQRHSKSYPVRGSSL